MSGLGRIAIVLVVGCCGLPAEGKYGGGSGTPEDPYLIYDANHMQAIGVDSNDWDKCFKLMADIDLGQFDGKDGREKFNIIRAYGGIFDGNGHTISNFSYDSNGLDHIGLFCFISDFNAVIKNIGIIDPNIDAGTGRYVGSLVGRLKRGTITNCYVMGGSVKGRIRIGGLVGEYIGTINGCFASSKVRGVSEVGGLLGSFSVGTITDCYATGSVTGDEVYVGGLVGFFSGGTITDSYATGSVVGRARTGGLAGHNIGTISNCYSKGSVMGDQVGGLVVDNYGTIANCYSTGSVTITSGPSGVGGLVLSNWGSITNCFWDIETSGQEWSGGGEGRTTSQMHQRSTFQAWDFVNVWGIGEKQTYPYLRRYLAGDINKDGIVNFKDFAIVALQWLEEYNVGNRAPEVLITYPEDGARLMVGGVPPQTLITAEAEDSDGAVVRVEFFDDEMKLGEDTDGSDGWNYLWTGYSLGWHTLTAVAWDEEGLSGTSAPVTVEVWMPDPPPP